MEDPLKTYNDVLKITGGEKNDYGYWNNINSPNLRSSSFDRFLEEIGEYDRWSTMTENEKIYIIQFSDKVDDGLASISDYKPYGYESYAREYTLKEEKQRWETARSQAEKGDYQPFINLVKRGGGDWYYYETEPKKEEILEQIDMELDNFNSGFYGSLESYAGEDVNTELLSTDDGIRKWLSQFGASPEFIDYVISFPDAPSVRQWKSHWEMGVKDWGGHFGTALFEGRMYDAVTYADGTNRANLKSMGYESYASEGYDSDVIFEFLFDLQESGVTNMFGAGPYVEREFPHLDKKEVRDVVLEWMQNYDEIADRMGIQF